MKYKIFVDRKLSLPYRQLGSKTPKIEVPEKFAEGESQYAHAAQHYAINNLYNQLESLTHKQNANTKLIYSLKTEADVNIFKTQIIDAITNDNFELYDVNPRGFESRVIDGEDKFVFIGYKFKGVDPQSAQKLAVLRQMIADGRLELKIAQSIDENGNIVNYQQVTQEGNTYQSINLEDIQSLIPVAKDYWLKAGASAKILDSLQFHVADLPPATAAITQGAQITLDATGAGWGWFIDPTPQDNSEFIKGASFGMDAPKDSAAYGKLDLLTVLIHEMGHALGMTPKLADDVMTRILDTGERRLPSELDALWLQRNASDQVAQTGVQVLQAKAWTAPTSNATLTNNDFATQGTNWLTTGDIRFDSRTHSATLSEAANTQTSLRQAFSLTADNRLLSFTIADKDIKVNANQNDVLAGTQVSQVNLQTQPAHGSVTIDANGNI